MRIHEAYVVYAAYAFCAGDREMAMQKKNEYQLRKAAGAYWLLHMTQKGMPFEKPQMLNACGALIFRQYADGKSTAEIARVVQQAYGIPEDVARIDTEAFIAQLEEQME